MGHPLKDPKSPHYQIWEGLEGIDILEKVLTRQEQIAWAKGNILKYRLRVGKKGDSLRDLEKIKHYEAYLAYLETKEKHDCREAIIPKARDKS